MKEMLDEIEKRFPSVEAEPEVDAEAERKKEEAKKAMLQSLNEPTPPKPKEDDEEKGLRNKLMSFFGLATPTEADEW
jgi:hypothetical protein